MHLDPADLEVGVDGERGGPGAGEALAGHLDADAAGLLAEEPDAAGAVDVRVDGGGQPGRHDHLEPTDVAAHVDRAPVQGRHVADVRQVEDELAGRDVVPVGDGDRRGGRLAQVGAVPPVGGRGPREHHARDEPDQDQPTRAAVERADQQHQAGDPDRDGGVGGAGHRRPGQVDDAEHALRERDQREREPEQDRAAAPRRTHRRRSRGRGPGRRLVRRRRTADPYGWAGGPYGAVPAGGRVDGLSRRVTRRSTTTAMIASGHGNQKRPRESPSSARAASTPTMIRAIERLRSSRLTAARSRPSSGTRSHMAP